MLACFDRGVAAADRAVAGVVEEDGRAGLRVVHPAALLVRAPVFLPAAAVPAVPDEQLRERRGRAVHAHLCQLLFISKYQFGLVGIALTLNFSWWAIATLLLAVVLNTVDNFSVLLAFTILHNSIQPILSGELFPCMGL
jgi:hypothetical protein